MGRYARLLAMQFKVALATSMQYRVDFVVQGLLALMWLGVAFVPLTVLFNDRRSVAGWTYPEALVVLGFFTLMKAVLEGAVSPSLTAVVEHVRKGTLDFVLLKPVDAQFMVSTAKFEVWRVVDVLGAFGIIFSAFHQLGRVPSFLGVLAAAGLILVAVMVLYSMWILVVCVSFLVVRVDNLGFLLGSLFDAARWPISIFQGVLRVVFTFIIPLALMTTWPAMALLGTLDTSTALVSLLGAAVFCVVARLAWLRALGQYTSASS